MRRLATLVVVAIAGLVLACRIGPARQPILLLVSFDGWRADYIERLPAPNLAALARRGVRSKALVPSFPALTFPNHYTIVTGLYPEHHGIVGNTMTEPGFPDWFTMSAPTARDARWWGGEPLWVTAERQGLRSAAMFWPGSEAAIRGVRPTYWTPFDDAMPNAVRVQHVLDWLALPEDRRPAFLTLYFSEVDHAGHDYGPDSPQLREAAAHLDEALGQTVSGIARLGLDDRTTIVVVSDHGMSQGANDRIVYLDDYADAGTFDLISSGGFGAIEPRSESAEVLYSQLHGTHPALSIYRREDLPARLHYRDNPRIRPIIAIADDGWVVTTHEKRKARKPDVALARADHGYDPALPSMHALLVTAGPRIRRNVLVEPLENVHLYDFLCEVLKLKPAPNDGAASATAGFFR